MFRTFQFVLIVANVIMVAPLGIGIMFNTTVVTDMLDKWHYLAFFFGGLCLNNAILAAGYIVRDMRKRNTERSYDHTA